MLNCPSATGWVGKFLEKELIPRHKVTALFFYGISANQLTINSHKPHIYYLSDKVECQTKREDPWSLTCIVVDVVDLHGRLGSVVAETPVLLQQLQTFIAIIHWAPAVVSAQHCDR